jgi:3-phenylpropionate/trans-cinnamate dioxygenase ferredoxin reductase subunit
MQDNVLIVGASQAGVQVAASLRDMGWTEAITLVGAEPHLPYQRPPLSKAALTNGVDPAELVLRTAQFFQDQEIDLVAGARVSTLCLGESGSGSVTLDSGHRLTFERLALTVGARPRRLDLPGSGLAGIHYLRNADDAKALNETLARGGRVVVVGGGFIGLEVAASAVRIGCSVSVVLADDRLMARAVSPTVSRYFLEAHAERGVSISCQSVPAAFFGTDGRVSGVRLADGTELPADVVVVGIGAAPRTELAEQAGLDVDGGIVVDEYGLASDGVTVAAGDCTVWPSVGLPGRGLRFESVNAAVEQAKTAAATICGQVRPWTNAPWFWSDQFDLKLQTVGTIPAGGSSVVRRDRGRPGLTVLHYLGHRLVASECVNRPADFTAAKSAINKGCTIDPSQAENADASLKSLVVGYAPGGVA